MIGEARKPTNLRQLPDGYRTIRVQHTLDDLHDQLRELISLVEPVSQQVPLPVEEPEEGFAVLSVSPVSVSSGTATATSTMIAGAGFASPVTCTFVATGPNMTNAPRVNSTNVNFLNQNLLVAQIVVSNFPTDYATPMYTYTVTVINPNGTPAYLRNGLTVMVTTS
jgi:hypothetical protein